MLSLAFTENKKSIRGKWDKEIIREFRKKVNKKLDYFGLPGPDICDFLDWENYLGWKTGIELVSTKSNKTQRDFQLRRVNQLQTNVMLSGFSENWELRRGEIEDIILNGTDIDGNKPALLIAEYNKAPCMKYDLHNWDFQGGLYTNRQNESKRIEAIKQCIKLQRDHHFLFLLTLNVRHTLGEELSTYLNGAAGEIDSNKHKEVLKWYSNRGSNDNTERYRLKAVVPLFIRQIAQVNSFDCFCYPPLYYEGKKEHLLHFVFELSPKKTVLPAFSQQKTYAVIELPLIIVENGQFILASLQHPHHCKKRLLTDSVNINLPVLEILQEMLKE